MRSPVRIAVCFFSLLVAGGLNARLLSDGAPCKGFDAFMHRINQSPLPLIPSFRSEDRQHVEKFVQHMARFVGEEQFTLKVGKALIKRAADVGLSVDGVVSDSGLDAVKVINQPMHEVNIDQHNAFALPLADALAFYGAINELTLLRRQAFETLEAQGVSHREAVAVLNDPKVKNSLEHLAQQTEALHECEIQIQKKAETLALDSLPKDGGPTDPSSGDGTILQDGPKLTDTVHTNLQKQDLQDLLEKRKALAAEVSRTAEDVQRASTNPGLNQWMERFKEGMDWAAHQYDQFLEHCNDAKNWAADNARTMLGAGLVATGLVVATLPLSGPSLAMAGGAVAITSGLETAGLVTTGMGLTGAGTTIMMNAKHEGGGNGSKQEPASQPGPQKPQTKPGQVGEYGKLKAKSTNDGLDVHHVPHDQYMKAHGVDKKDGISTLVDRATHRQIHFGPKGLRSIDPQMPARTALYKSVQRIKTVFYKSVVYTRQNGEIFCGKSSMRTSKNFRDCLENKRSIHDV